MRAEKNSLYGANILRDTITNTINALLLDAGFRMLDIEESKYLVRIVKTESQTLLYVFSSDKSKTHFTIHFSPSEAEYKIDDLSKPIEILEEDLIESITLN